MNEEIARRRNNEPLELGAEACVALGNLVHNRGRFTIDQFIASLQVTTTLTDLSIWFPDDCSKALLNHRRIIEQLCRCIADLRSNNKDHPLNTLQIYSVSAVYIDQFLVSVKKLGIRQLEVFQTNLPIQPLWSSAVTILISKS